MLSELRLDLKKLLRRHTYCVFDVSITGTEFPAVESTLAEQSSSNTERVDNHSTRSITGLVGFFSFHL